MLLPINQPSPGLRPPSVAQPSRLRVVAASRRQQEHPAGRVVNSQARTPALHSPDGLRSHGALDTARRHGSLGTWICLASGLAVIAIRTQAAEGFVMFPRPMELPEQGFVTSYVVQSGTNQFTFLPVRKWHLESHPAEQTVTFIAPDLSTSISFQIVRKSSGLAPEIKSEVLRDWIRGRYPKAAIVREFVCFANGGQGLAFDLEQTLRKDLSTTSRLAFIPFPDGVVEFNLTAPAAKFLSYKLALGNLLTSFQVEAVNPSSAPPASGP